MKCIGQDLKYDIYKHPNIALITDGGAEPYCHGTDKRSFATLVFDESLIENTTNPNADASGFELLSEEELEELIKEGENNNE